jgi:hypothetical protein
MFFNEFTEYLPKRVAPPTVVQPTNAYQATPTRNPAIEVPPRKSVKLPLRIQPSENLSPAIATSSPTLPANQRRIQLGRMAAPEVNRNELETPIDPSQLLQLQQMLQKLATGQQVENLIADLKPLPQSMAGLARMLETTAKPADLDKSFERWANSLPKSSNGMSDEQWYELRTKLDLMIHALTNLATTRPKKRQIQSSWLNPWKQTLLNWKESGRLTKLLEVATVALLTSALTVGLLHITSSKQKPASPQIHPSPSSKGGTAP